jgi:hypothetical protein
MSRAMSRLGLLVPLLRGAGGEGGEFTILRRRVLASKSKKRDQSDPHVAELSTQQKKPKYVGEIIC